MAAQNHIIINVSFICGDRSFNSIEELSDAIEKGIATENFKPITEMKPPFEGTTNGFKYEDINIRLQGGMPPRYWEEQKSKPKKKK